MGSFLFCLPPTLKCSQGGLDSTVTELDGILLPYSVVPWPSRVPCKCALSLALSLSFSLSFLFVFVLVSVSGLAPATSGGTVVCSVHVRAKRRARCWVRARLCPGVCGGPHEVSLTAQWSERNSVVLCSSLKGRMSCLPQAWGVWGG